MARRSSRDEATLDRVIDALDDAPAGLHELAPRLDELPAGLPGPLIELYARCDGGRLFIDSIELRGSQEVARDPEGGDAWVFGALEDEDLLVDGKGRVWRMDPSLDQRVCEGTALDRWLAGIVDALALLYDRDGEFADEVFDEDGELLPIIAEKQLRAILKRDPKAPAPRWRLAHVLLTQDAIEDARRQLEEVVATTPTFAFAWLDLAKISENRGDLGNALDEATEAANVAEEQRGYFWTQVARIAAKKGDEAARAAAATHVPSELKADQLAGANESLANEDLASARGLLELLRAVWPRDLEVLDLARRIGAAST